jgi:hypothetical protein
MVLKSPNQSKAHAVLRALTASDPALGDANEWTPAWSSRVLEDKIQEIITRPNGDLLDVFKALWELTGQSDVLLTRTLANFIKDIVVLCFTKYRSKYDSINFLWMADKIQLGCTPSQAYLAALALPNDLIELCQNNILLSLKGTVFRDEIEKMI